MHGLVAISQVCYKAVMSCYGLSVRWQLWRVGLRIALLLPEWGEFSINVGLNYRKVMIIGLSIIALISGVVVSVVGALPFLGLIVPNLVSPVMGDNIRKTIPWVFWGGGFFGIFFLN